MDLQNPRRQNDRLVNSSTVVVFVTLLLFATYFLSSSLFSGEIICPPANPIVSNKGNVVSNLPQEVHAPVQVQTPVQMPTPIQTPHSSDFNGVVETDTYCAIPKILLLSSQQSGTTWFSSLLSKHPQIDMGVGIGVLEHKRIREWSADFNLDPEKPISQKHWEYILAYTKSGFVIMNWQAKTEDGNTILTMAHAGNYTVLHLVRRNVLRKAISRLLADRLRTTHCYVGGSCVSYEGIKIKIDTTSIVDRLKGKEREYESNRQIISQYNLKSHEIFYEDLVADTQKEMCKVYNFLQCTCLSSQQLISSVVKRGASNLADEIENFDELVQALKGTKYESMVFDP